MASQNVGEKQSQGALTKHEASMRHEARGKLQASKLDEMRVNKLIRDRQCLVLEALALTTVARFHFSSVWIPTLIFPKDL